MKFQLYTLVDITKTNARKGDSFLAQNQQQNYLTCLQTISLRANPTLLQDPKNELINIKVLNFGKLYNGKHMVWKLDFDFEHESAHSTIFLEKDFNFVPIIDNLNETCKFPTAIFNTTDENLRNIFFQIIT